MVSNRKIVFVAGMIAVGIIVLCCACNETNKSQNSSTAKPPVAVFMGNSITEGWVTMDKSFFTSHRFVGKGISGQTTGQMLDRFKTDVVDLKPAVVVILGGINDIAENDGPVTLEKIFQNIVSMAELAQANHIKVVLCAVLPTNKISWRTTIKPIDKIIQLNTMIKNYCVEHALPYVDYYTAMVDKAYGLDSRWANDGVHPTLEGYKIMEPLVVTAIEEIIPNQYQD